MPFYIAEFTDEKKNKKWVREVPTGWVEDKSRCYWPNAISESLISKMIGEEAKKNERTWKVFDVNLLAKEKEFATHDDAIVACEKLIYETDIEETDNEGNNELNSAKNSKRIKIVKDKVLAEKPQKSPEEIVNDSALTTKLKDISKKAASSVTLATAKSKDDSKENTDPGTPKSSKSKGNSKDNTDPGTPKSSKSKENSKEDSAPETPKTDSKKKTDPTVKDIYDLVYDMGKLVIKIYKRQETAKEEPAVESKVRKQQVQLKLHDRPQVEACNKKLENDPEYKEEVKATMVSKGGTSAGDFLIRLLKLTYSNEGAMNITMQGATRLGVKKLAFMKSELQLLIFDVIHNAFSVTDSSLEEQAEFWFKNAKQRHTKEKAALAKLMAKLTQEDLSEETEEGADKGEEKEENTGEVEEEKAASGEEGVENNGDDGDGDGEMIVGY